MTTKLDEAQGDVVGSLAGRAEFDRRMEAALDDARARHTKHVLLRVDVTTGSEAVLVGVIAVLASLLREGDVMTRQGRAGIALLMENCDLVDGLQVARILRALLRLGEGARPVDGPPLLGIGVVEIDGRNGDAEELRRRAAEACGAAHSRGVNRIQVHESGRER
jgi:GGDEF domain-containing protein